MIRGGVVWLLLWAVCCVPLRCAIRGVLDLAMALLFWLAFSAVQGVLAPPATCAGSGKLLAPGRRGGSLLVVKSFRVLAGFLSPVDAAAARCAVAGLGSAACSAASHWCVLLAW